MVLHSPAPYSWASKSCDKPKSVIIMLMTDLG